MLIKFWKDVTRSEIKLPKISFWFLEASEWHWLHKLTIQNVKNMSAFTKLQIYILFRKVIGLL